MKKASTIGYYLLLVTGMLLVLLVNIDRSIGNYEKYRGSTGTKIEPTEVEEISEDIREYYFSKETLEGECLAFFSNHQCIRAYADESLIYAVEGKNNVLGKTPGSYWNFITIPDEIQELKVEIEAVYPQVREREINFLIGDAKEIYRKLIQESVPETVISIIDILIGVGMSIYWFVAKRRGHGEKSTLFFGLFATLLGLWSLNETTLICLVTENHVATALDAYIFLMLMMIPYIHFSEDFLEMGHRKGANILSMLGCASILVLSILHFTGIREFKQTLIVTHILIIVEFVYCLSALFIRAKQRGFDRKVKISFIGIFGFFCAFVTDMAAYYIGKESTDIFARLALLVYILLLGYEVVLETIERSEEWQKTEIYRELAIKDTLTGLYNRNAYNQWLEEHGKDQNVAVLMCDLNDLKKCNDTRGHAVGDSYIMGAADIIARVFEGQGTCYRIGGDEFCVILKDAEKIDIQDKIRELDEMEAECNRMMAEMKINIAYGYAVFDHKLDHNIEDTCKRADEEMYRNKKEQKMLKV